MLFLDEPTTGLDPRGRNEVWAAVRALVADGTTVLLTTQYLEEADQLADRIAVVDHGRVIAEDSPRGAEGIARAVTGSTSCVRDAADLVARRGGARATPATPRWTTSGAGQRAGRATGWAR